MSTTRRWLVRRTVALLALTATTAATLLAAYGGVHRHVEPLRTQISPAILEVTAARKALFAAHGVATTTLESSNFELVGTGGTYRTQIAVANQSLSRAAEAGVAGESGLRQLQTVAGLIVAYSGWIEQADRSRNASALRDAYLFYAQDTLDGIENLLTREIQELQKEELARQASPTWLVWSALGLAALLVGLCVALAALPRANPASLPSLWARLRRRGRPRRRVVRAFAIALAPLALWLAAQVPPWWLVWSAWLAGALLCAALTALLLSTQSALRRRFRRRRNPPLLAACGVLVASLLLLGGLTAWTVRDMSRSQGQLTETIEVTEVSDDAPSVPRTSREVNARLRLPDWWVVPTAWSWLAGPAVGGLVLWGMLPRILEYRYQGRWTR
ncbi:hypothetical protein [Streptomyces sp. 6N223]|uniref:hypothetical protein n=1 Tax=Streptomyces sp. 6N223 TaxID=3457412 RepID=UPI003FD4BE05